MKHLYPYILSVDNDNKITVSRITSYAFKIREPLWPFTACYDALYT